jgi:outer membrane protein assembly factor BamB
MVVFIGTTPAASLIDCQSRSATMTAVFTPGAKHMRRGHLLACFLVLALSTRGWGEDWPGWLGAKRDSVWRETGIIDKFPPEGPKVLWRMPIAGGYAGPAVADGRVYVHDFDGKGDVSANPGGRSDRQGKERVLCLDAKTGKELWKHEHDVNYKISYAYGPRCTPTVADGKVYTLGAEGLLCCLDADKGTELWSKDLKAEYKTTTPMWGFAGHPLVDGQKLICLVGGEGSVAVAFDKDTGKELWKALSAKDQGYCAPSIIEAGGTRQLLIWHPLALNSLDPETGKLHWSIELKPDYEMSIQIPRQLGDYLFAGGIGMQCVCLNLAKDKPAAEEVWRGDISTGVFPVNSTPFLEDGMIYGCCTKGELRGVELATGKRLWETLKPTTNKRPQQSGSGTAFIVKNGERFFLFSETGDLIIAKLSPAGYEEISRAHLLEPTQVCFGRPVIWSHPAFAGKCAFLRNDKEIICVNLAAR